jgi:hypothetical protein
LSELNADIHGLGLLLKYKRRMRTFWQETRDPGFKTEVNWVSKAIRHMTRKKALERWEYKLANTEVTPQTIWPIAKSLANRDGPRAPPVIYGPLGPTFQPTYKANEFDEWLEKQSTPHKLCDENHKRQVEARVQALLEAKDNEPPEKVRPCDLQKLINSLKLNKAYGIDGIPNECLRHLPRRPLVHLTHLINHCIRLSHFPTSWKEAKVVAFLVRILKSPKIYVRLVSCPQRANV